MSCCQTPLGLAYLRGLLARRQDIAVYPSDALDQSEPPANLYFYRPGEVLVRSSHTALFEETAKRIGVRYHRLLDQPAPMAEASEDADREAQSEAVGRWHPSTMVARFAIGARDDLDTVLGRLERATRGKLGVSPNHVLFGSPDWVFDPATEPVPWQDASALPVQASSPSGVVVAVIDSGLPEGFASNPLLAQVDADAEEEPWVYAGGSHVLTFPQGHGSFVAGVVRQSDPQATVRSYLVLDGDDTTDEWSLATQIGLALEAEPQVVNLSLGSTTRNDESLMGLGPLQLAAQAPGGPIVVAAAGNLASSQPFYPAAEDWVIGVAAVQMVGDPASPVQAGFTNYGSWVDVCAVGVNVISSYEFDPYQPISASAPILQFQGAAMWSGTSFAAPQVAGAVAQLRAGNPLIDRAGVLAHFAARATAPGGFDVSNLGPFVP